MTKPRRDRLTPLEPIFNPEPRRGGILVGNTPGVTPSAPMILHYDTTLSTGTEIGIYLEGFTGSIDWGDSSSTASAGDMVYSHTFASEGLYEVRISGTATWARSSLSLTPMRKLVTVESWGSLGLTSLQSFAQLALNLSDVPTSIPSTVTDLSYMFGSTEHMNDADVGGWDTSNVTNMSDMFYDAPNFNQDIGGWDTSNVTDMTRMFNNATFFNQDLSGWCVTLIPSEPTNFSTSAFSWVLPKPVWGTCPP